jgi:Right handed beta helix region
MTRWRVVAACLLAASATVLAGCTTDAPQEPDSSPSPEVSAPAGTGTTLHVAPDGSGDCSESAPCTIHAAVEAAQQGSTLLLQSGDYGDLEIVGPEHYASFSEPVVVSPAPDAEVQIGRLDASTPWMTWRDLSLSDVLYVNDRGHDQRFERIHLDGAGAFLKSRNIAVVDSLFENGSSIDGIQIAGESITVERTTIRNYDQSGDSGLHADCIQIFDSENVTIRANRLSNCYNSSLIFSPGAGLGISEVLVESNFIQGCTSSRDLCKEGTLMDLRLPEATDVVVRNNTMLGGGVRLDPQDDIVVDRNIFDYLSNCDAKMTNSIVERWNEGLCEEPDAIGRDGNRVGTVEVLDREGGDFTLEDIDSALIEPMGDFEPAPASIEGTPLDPAVAGASNG